MIGCARYKFLVKCVACGTFLPYIKSVVWGYTCKELTIYGEIYFLGLGFTLEFQKESGIMGIPYQNFMFMGEGKSRDSVKEQNIPCMTNFIWGRQSLDFY